MVLCAALGRQGEGCQPLTRRVPGADNGMMGSSEINTCTAWNREYQPHSQAHFQAHSQAHSQALGARLDILSTYETYFVLTCIIILMCTYALSHLTSMTHTF